mmetsp:Transcript_11991/g.27748  ORF Transcript_11991/g.27748 Transcript_11991/m.27748 type:complete len:278 (-) Transcript_11991:70-903(-)
MFSLCICIIRNGIQVYFNLVFVQNREDPVGSFHETNFELTSTKVGSQDGPQACNGRSDGLIGCHFQVLLRSHFFQEIHGLLFLGTTCGGPKGQQMSGTIHLVDRRSTFVIDAYHECHTSEWSHTCRLCIDLGQVGHALGQHRNGCRIAVIKRPLIGFVTSPLHKRLVVGRGATTATSRSRGTRHDAGTQFGGDLVHMRHRIRLDQSVDHLFLGHHADGILPANRNARQTPRNGCLVSILHLIQSSLRTENTNMMIIIRVTAHDEKTFCFSTKIQSKW